MIEELIADLTPGKAIAWSAAILLISLVAYEITLDRRISRLGAHPPIIRSYLPLGKFSICECLILATRISIQ